MLVEALESCTRDPWFNPCLVLVSLGKVLPAFIPVNQGVLNGYLAIAGFIRIAGPTGRAVRIQK